MCPHATFIKNNISFPEFSIHSFTSKFLQMLFTKAGDEKSFPEKGFSEDIKEDSEADISEKQEK